MEYTLLFIAVFGIGLKVFWSAPRTAFKESAPRLAIRVEKQLETGQGFMNGKNGQSWKGE